MACTSVGATFLVQSVAVMIEERSTGRTLLLREQSSYELSTEKGVSYVDRNKLLVGC
jgi:hypothetical protein